MLELFFAKARVKIGDWSFLVKAKTEVRVKASAIESFSGKAKTEIGFVLFG